MFFSNNHFENFTQPKYAKKFKRKYYSDENSSTFSDFTPYLHKKTNKIIITGHQVN